MADKGREALFYDLKTYYDSFFTHCWSFLPSSGPSECGKNTCNFQHVLTSLEMIWKVVDDILRGKVQPESFDSGLCC
jgi:hypothetical protein